MTKIDLEFMNLVNKYNYYYYDFNKVHLLFSNNNVNNIKNKIKKIIKKKNITNGEIIITKLSKVSKKLYNENKNSKLKLIGGPIYIKLQKYTINNSFLKKDLNNKVYFPKKYIKSKLSSKNNKWLIKDINKIVKMFAKNKIKKSLIGINTIQNIIL